MFGTDCTNYRVVRRATDAIDDLYAIVLACGEDMYTRLGLDHWRPPTPFHLFRLHAEIRQMYAVMRDHRAVATFTLSPEPPEPYPHTSWADAGHSALYLTKLAVHPTRQGTGLGRRCLEYIERLAREQGFDAVRFDALTRNAPLLAFYDKFGYHRRGNMRVLDELHREWDIVLYEKVLIPMQSQHKARKPE
jgi:ribosomal protein S18 acetylase RimI-like enzyme